MQVIGDSGQGWINCILYIFFSPNLRRRLFLHPFKRLVKRSQKAFMMNESTTRATAPLRGFTQQTMSTRARAEEEGITYYSTPTEFSNNSE